jgi:G3E family GTPase
LHIAIQVEFADVILLNKCDLVQDPGVVASVRRTVAALNPSARIVETVMCDVEMSEILDTGRWV